MKAITNIMALAAVLNFSAQAATLTVRGDANIFGAGHDSAPAPGGGSGGSLPPEFDFAPATGQVLSFSSVSGQSTLSLPYGFNGPNGSSFLPTDMSSFGGISGIRSDGAGYLTGVFLGLTVPGDPVPAVLDFSASGIGRGFSTLAPEIGQTFLIGDGLGTSSGGLHQYIVPDTATRLFLGFADGWDYRGLPGQYQDNAGKLTATFEMVPEPSTYALFILGIGCLLTLRVAKRRC